MVEVLFVFVKGDEFDLSKFIFDKLYVFVVKEEVIEWGYFRGEGLIYDIIWLVVFGEMGYYFFL